MWVVESIDRATGAATIARVDAKGTTETQDVALDDLVVVAEFRDPIYPGLVSTGKVERGGDKPYHSVINGENFHALQTLLFTHRGKVDAIYIDPPYNTGARDWKYNNDYVESRRPIPPFEVARVHGAPPPPREGAAEPRRLGPHRHDR